MKKHIFLCTAVILFMFLLSAGASASEGTDYVVQSAEAVLISSPDMNGETVDIAYKGTILTVTQQQSGYGYVSRVSTGCSGWADMDDLRLLQSQQSDAETVTGISVIAPEKLTYVIGEDELDDSGLLVYALFADGSKKQITGYNIVIPPFTTLGEKKIYITYCPPGTAAVFSSSFTVSVVRIPVASVSLEGEIRTDYPEKSILQTDGMLLRVTYLDGRADTVLTVAEALRDSRFTAVCKQGELQYQPLALGTHTIRFSFLYTDVYTDYTFTVRERRPASLSVYRLPDNTAVFTDTMTLSVTGLRLLVVYDNNEKEYIDGTDAEILFDAGTAVYGANSVTVRYGDVQTSYTVTVRDPEKTGLTVLHTGRTVYAVGESPDWTDLQIGLVYESGTVTPYDRWEITGFDTVSVGERQYTVSGDGFSININYYVTEYGFIPGDYNADGILTAADARLILRASVRLETPTGVSLLAADRNGDGEIRSDDARLTLRAAVRLDPVIPTE